MIDLLDTQITNHGSKRKDEEDDEDDATFFERDEKRKEGAEPMMPSRELLARCL